MLEGMFTLSLLEPMLRAVKLTIFPILAGIVPTGLLLLGVSCVTCPPLHVTPYD